MMSLIAAFFISIDPCEEIKIPEELIKYKAIVDTRPFPIRLLSSIRIKQVSVIPLKIQIKGGTDF
jgi:hypothetical protein